MSDDCKECCDSACVKSESPRIFYSYSGTLNKEKTWNEEIKKYLFISPVDGKILLVNNDIVEFSPITYNWKFMDMFNDGIFDNITIKKVN